MNKLTIINFFPILICGDIVAPENPLPALCFSFPSFPFPIIFSFFSLNQILALKPIYQLA